MNLSPFGIRRNTRKYGKSEVQRMLSGSTAFLTVSVGTLSRGLLAPPGVKVGLKDMERFPDMDATEGTTSFCTGGRVVSI